MTTTATATRRDSRAVSARTRRAFVISIGIAVLFIFLQSLTAGEFISDGLDHNAREVWTDVHGFIAYPIMVASLVAAIVAASRLRAIRGLALFSSALFAGTVVQWLLGHAITTLGWDWVTPLHVVLAFVVYGLAIWLSVASARLPRRGIE